MNLIDNNKTGTISPNISLLLFAEIVPPQFVSIQSLINREVQPVLDSSMLGGATCFFFFSNIYLVIVRYNCTPIPLL